jgi:beta-galactosidase
MQKLSCNEKDPLIQSQDPYQNSTTVKFRSLLKAVLVPTVILILVLVRHIHLWQFKSTTPIFQSPRISTQNSNEYIYPGQIFRDTKGDPINAHGGGLLHYNNTYYWYGEIKQGKTYLPIANVDWDGTRVDFVGISCYASIDLLNWRKCKTYNVLPAVNDDPSHDLHWSKVGERPKVVYNAKTEMFVIWLHVDTMDYRLARCGVATSSSPEGKFTYHNSFQPNGQMARDLTVFVDDDLKAHLFTSSEDNAAIHVSELTEDYLSTSGGFTMIFVGEYVEAPTVFKRNDVYYFIGSGCSAWNANAAKAAFASSILGPWTFTGNPCKGENANTTFYSQSTYVIPVSNGTDSMHIFAADRWKTNNLSDSRYVWLPITFVQQDGVDEIEIKWQDYWRPDNYIMV